MRVRLMLLVLVMAIVSPAMGIEIYGGGVYTSAQTQSPLNQAWGGEVQIRQQLGDSGLYTGLGLGAEQWRMGDKRESYSSRFYSRSEITHGDVKNLPITALALYKLPLGDKVVGFSELGVTYNITDTDIQYTETHSLFGMAGAPRTTDAGYTLGNVWTGRFGGGVEVPFADTVSLGLSAGYQWQLNKYDHGRVLEGVYGRLGLVFKL